LLIPLEPVPAGFKDRTVYSPADFLKYAAALAKRRATFDDRPKKASAGQETTPAKTPPAGL